MNVIVVAGGDAAADDADRLDEADLVIAADSGAAWLAAQGLRPNVVIGDMDSIEPALLDRLIADGVEIQRHPADKDASDAELAIARAVAAGAGAIVILGALGGQRLDHELANLLLLADPARRGMDLAIVRGGITARALFAGDTLTLGGGRDDLVSLLPIGGDAVGVTSSGLEFGLAEETLRLGSSRGLSNRVSNPPASASLAGGTLLVVETKRETHR